MKAKNRDCLNIFHLPDAPSEKMKKNFRRQTEEKWAADHFSLFSFLRPHHAPLVFGCKDDGRKKKVFWDEGGGELLYSVFTEKEARNGKYLV